jgi:hypothetical protein
VDEALHAIETKLVCDPNKLAKEITETISTKGININT